MKALACLLLILCAVFLSCGFCKANDGKENISPALTEADLARIIAGDDEKLDLYCLLRSYPQISGLERNPDGTVWLAMRDGKKVRYSLYDWEHTKKGAHGTTLDDDRTSVAATMEDPYPLEPHRPGTLPGNSPGRKRSKAFLQALYGSSQKEIGNKTEKTKFMGKNIPLSPAPARAFAGAAPKLEQLARENPALQPYLQPDGWYYWRNIAGEKRLSPHAYGIALDFGARVAPYWRWAKIMPHPDQKIYSPQIVRTMEENGFIWGGKWHEYDLMHFEYRPELICKAKIRRRYAE